MTSYIVFKRSLATGPGAGKTGWVELTQVDAPSSPAAVRAALNGADEGGEFVAVPARSWQPVKVSIEKAIKLG